MLRYSTYEDEYIQQYFTRKTNKEISRELGRTERGISNRLESLGLNRNLALGKPKRIPTVIYKFPLSAKAEAFEMYKSGYRLFEIINKIGASRGPILKWIGEIEGYRGTNGVTITLKSKV